MGWCGTIKGGEDLLFDSAVFRRRLDNEVSVPGRLIQRCCRRQPPERLLPLLFCQRSLLELAVEIAPDRCHAALDKFCLKIIEDNVEAILREDMRNAVSHRTCADHCHVSKIHVHVC